MSEQTLQIVLIAVVIFAAIIVLVLINLLKKEKVLTSKQRRITTKEANKKDKCINFMINKGMHQSLIDFLNAETCSLAQKDDGTNLSSQEIRTINENNSLCENIQTTINSK
ncbi:MAG: hypothetical protein R3Y43_06510 [Alphaproteobacteria bacterium]